MSGDKTDRKNWERIEKRVAIWVLTGLVTFIAWQFVDIRSAVEVFKVHAQRSNSTDTKHYLLISGNAENIQGIDIRLTKVETKIEKK